MLTVADKGRGLKLTKNLLTSYVNAPRSLMGRGLIMELMLCDTELAS